MAEIIDIHRPRIPKREQAYKEVESKVFLLLNDLSTTQACSLAADLYVFLGTLVFKDSDQCERYIREWIQKKFDEYQIGPRPSA